VNVEEFDMDAVQEAVKRRMEEVHVFGKLQPGPMVVPTEINSIEDHAFVVTLTRLEIQGAVTAQTALDPDSPESAAIMDHLADVTSRTPNNVLGNIICEVTHSFVTLQQALRASEHGRTFLAEQGIEPGSDEFHLYDPMDIPEGLGADIDAFLASPETGIRRDLPARRVSPENGDQS
jgi:hypothetical protein